MAYNALKELTAPELTAKGRDLRQELFNLRLHQSTARMEKSHRLSAIRRDIARCETRLTELRKKS